MTKLKLKNLQKNNKCVFVLVEFYGLSTIAVYLMPNLLNIRYIRFGLVPFYDKSIILGKCQILLMHKLTI